MYTVYQLTIVSIIVQAITGILAFPGFFLQLSPQDNILKSILSLETFVQIIEFCFYIWFVLRFNLQNMAATRYFDWFITTPTMLFTTITFMKYKELYENKQDTEFTITEFIKDNKNDILIIVLSNLGMLLFGYLGEIGYISRILAASIGFIFFGLTFYIIYTKFAINSKLGKNLFIFIFIVWSLYGFAYLLNTVNKNIFFNCLDIVAKNFFGIYLVYVIYSKSLK